MRLFFAVWPDEAAHQRLAALATKVAEATGGRPTPEANIHMTLEFLGDVAEERLPQLRAIAAAPRIAPFDLSLDRLGAFRRARVAWIGSSRPPHGLLELQKTLAGGLAAAGFALEERPFAPHVTLARKIERPLSPEPVEPIRWKVDALALVRSHAGKYATLASWRLASR